MDSRLERTGERVLVTGCAGFLGSHLSERLIAGGTQVLGVDCLTDYYSPSRKERNLARLLDHSTFTFLKLDLSVDPLEGMLEGVDAVYHLAGQPGVRASFGEAFDSYFRN